MRKPRINIFGGKEHPRAFSEGRGVIFQQHKEHPGVKFPRGVDLFFFVRGTPRTHTHTHKTYNLPRTSRAGIHDVGPKHLRENIQEAEEGRLGNLAPFAAGGGHSRSRRRAVGEPCAVRRRGMTPPPTPPPRPKRVGRFSFRPNHFGLDGGVGGGVISRRRTVQGSPIAFFFMNAFL